MPVKTTGAEFKRFYDDPEFWPDGVYHEDDLTTADGEEVDDYTAIADTAVVVIRDGSVSNPMLGGEVPSFEAYFKRWRKKQTSDTLIVECDKTKVDAVRAAIKAAGGKVL